jgi:hypothetical protein
MTEFVVREGNPSRAIFLLLQSDACTTGYASYQ